MNWIEANKFTISKNQLHLCLAGMNTVTLCAFSLKKFALYFGEHVIYLLSEFILYVFQSLISFSQHKIRASFFYFANCKTSNELRYKMKFLNNCSTATAVRMLVNYKFSRLIYPFLFELMKKGNLCR